MIDPKRHMRIFNPGFFSHPVHIIGCGGMGSRVAEGLVRMGVGIPGQSPIHLYDSDSFADHNLANQWLTRHGIKSWKVLDVGESMRSINPDCEIHEHIAQVAEYLPLSGVVFLCVDSMAARRTIMEEVIEKNPDVVCVIETRMDAEVGISHCFNPHNQRQSDCWWLYWYSDDEADHIGGCAEPQSIISAIYGTTMLALKQFEQFARTQSTYDMPNRLYFDYATFTSLKQTWRHLTEW